MSTRGTAPAAGRFLVIDGATEPREAVALATALAAKGEVRSTRPGDAAPADFTPTHVFALDPDRSPPAVSGVPVRTTAALRVALLTDAPHASPGTVLERAAALKRSDQGSSHFDLAGAPYWLALERLGTEDAPVDFLFPPLVSAGAAPASEPRSVLLELGAPSGAGLEALCARAGLTRRPVREVSEIERLGDALALVIHDASLAPRIFYRAVSTAMRDGCLILSVVPLPEALDIERDEEYLHVAPEEIEAALGRALCSPLEMTPILVRARQKFAACLSAEYTVGALLPTIAILARRP